jgi:hypothetical protein
MWRLGDVAEGTQKGKEPLGRSYLPQQCKLPLMAAFSRIRIPGCLSVRTFIDRHFVKAASEACRIGETPKAACISSRRPHSRDVLPDSPEMRSLDRVNSQQQKYP